MKITTILVPVDFSEVAENSFLYALEVAKAFGAAIKVLHVYHIPSMMYAGAAIDEKIRLEMQQEVQLKLKAFMQKHQDALKGVNCQAEEVYGYFEEEMKEKMKEEAIDLVIMGTEGASGLKKMIGSNAYHLMSESQRPVMAVPPKARFNGIKRILFACDIHANIEAAALNLLKSFSAGFGAKVEVVHVQEDFTVGDSVQKKVIARLNAQLEDVDHSFEIVKGKEVDRSLQQFLKDRPADLLFLIPREQLMLERFFKGSVTRELAFHPQLPILTLKAKK